MEHLVRGDLALARGSLLRIEDGRGMTVTVSIGSLWITQEGDRRDRHVGPGESFRIDAAGLTLISALRRSVISLAVADERGFSARLANLWAGWFASSARPTTAAL
jgi:hypothetical protein